MTSIDQIQVDIRFCLFILIMLLFLLCLKNNRFIRVRWCIVLFLLLLNGLIRRFVLWRDWVWMTFHIEKLPLHRQSFFLKLHNLFMSWDWLNLSYLPEVVVSDTNGHPWVQDIRDVFDFQSWKSTVSLTLHPILSLIILESDLFPWQFFDVCWNLYVILEFWICSTQRRNRKAIPLIYSLGFLISFGCDFPLCTDSEVFTQPFLLLNWF